jgi:hypothetical protein
MIKLREIGVFLAGIILIIGCGLRPAFAAEGGNTSASTPVASATDRGNGAANEVRIARFATRQEAETFAKRIAAGGYEPVIRTETTDEGRTVYSVFVALHDEQPKESLQLPVTGETGKTQNGEMPVGSPSYADIFGGRSFFHASLAFTQLYTDNAFISNTNKKSGSSTVVTPEVWILLPRTEERPPQIEDISTSAPGGLILSRVRPEVSRRYEAFLLYHADVPLYSNLPSSNTITQRLAGRFIYNGNRVFGDLSDQFVRSYDIKGTGNVSDPVEVDKYWSNLVDGSISYDTHNRFRLMLDYSNFLLRYDDTANDFRDRIDNALAGYVFYQIQPKTALFAEYDFIDITHDRDSSFDSREHNIFGGIQWDITAKSKGTVKAGYGIKDFTNIDTTSRNYIFEAQITHHLSSKNTLILKAYRQTDESDFEQTSFIITDSAKAEYLHRITARFTGAAGFAYTRETYEGGDFTLDGVTQQRKDSVYDAILSLRYQFERRLQADIGYDYTRNDSNFSDFSYTSNTFFFRLTGSI